MSLGELKDGVSAEDQLLEILGDNNKEDENAEEVKATMHIVYFVKYDDAVSFMTLYPIQ